MIHLCVIKLKDKYIITTTDMKDKLLLSQTKEMWDEYHAQLQGKILSKQQQHNLNYYAQMATQQQMSLSPLANIYNQFPYNK